MPTAGNGEVVVRNRAIAVNPVSCKCAARKVASQRLNLKVSLIRTGTIQDTGKVAQKWPVVLDFDVAGEVHEVGEDVTDFRPGDRVVA